MSDQKHWIETPAVRKRFWSYAKRALNLTEEQVHQALGVESVKDFTDDKVAALTLLNNYAAGVVPHHTRDELAPQEPVHAEARVIAFCDLYTPSGTRISLTAREGATHDDLVLTTLALTDASKTLINVFGFSGTPQKYTPAKKPTSQTKAPSTTKAPTPTPPTPPPAPGNVPPPPGNAPPPPPMGTPPAQPAENGQAQSGIIQAEIIKITAPKGKPVVEFWRPNRKYAEVRWQLGGEKLLAIAPTLKAAKWQVVHFEANSVGQEYQLAVNVHWTRSACGKYKDITKVELR